MSEAQSLKITKIADLETAFGKKLAKQVKGLAQENMMRLPRSVSWHASKPASGVDLERAQIGDRAYCGSGMGGIIVGCFML